MVKEAVLKLQSDDSIHVLQRLCAKFALEEDAQAGKDALGYLNGSGEVPRDITEECLELAIKPQNTHQKETQDGIVSSLLRSSTVARTALAKRLQESSTLSFNLLYAIGDGSSNAVAAVVLDTSAWPTEAARETCERDVFQLFLAKLIEAGHDLDARALRGISRLLAADADKLQDLLDEQTFNAILSSLDNRLPVEVRTQATLATAKYLEVAEDNAKATISKFILSRLARHNGENLVLAFSVAATIFPLAPSMASALFNAEGFVPSLIPLLEKKVKSQHVKQAALDMLNAACIDSACRESVSKYCTGWLQEVMESRKELKPGSAAVILAKVRGLSLESSNQTSSHTQNGNKDIDGLLPIFRQMMIENVETEKPSAIEGLAFVSAQPEAKERIVTDKELVKSILLNLRTSQADSPMIFGGLTILNNLTRYLPIIIEEQKRISQLKAYASATKVTLKPSSLEEDTAVTKRCTALVNAGVVETLATISKIASRASMSIISNILLSLSRTPSHRGVLVQQGVVKLLLQNWSAVSQTGSLEARSCRSAAHALARVLISVDPALVFTSGPLPLTSAIRPLLSLLTEDPDLTTDSPRDLLPTFEALLALTNLASEPSSEAADMIIRLGFPTVEDLLLSNNEMIRRAAMELVCNLMICSSGIQTFADGSKTAARRLHIVLALADVDDIATRRAASGALATITESESAVKEILSKERGVKILLSLCEDEEDGIVHRGVICVNNLLQATEKTGDAAKEKVLSNGGIDILKGVAQESENRGILEPAIEALKVLIG